MTVGPAECGEEKCAPDHGTVKERTLKENPGTEVQTGTRSSERGDEEQDRPGRWLDVAGGAAVETECYGTDVIKTVISGSHYSRAHTAHSIIHEVLTSMMFEAFLSKFPERLTELDALQVNCQSKELTSEEWNTTKERADSIKAAFQDYLKERASLSQSFDYWKTYVSDLFPIIRDLTNSLRSGDWILYLSAIERATSLFFFFGRTNYCRWTPLFLQDCYQLKDKFPLLYDSYMNGGFVVNTTKKGSGVPFDQALEQCYNRPAKVSGGIIGVTRKKEAVALWGIIKHKKDQYVELLEMKGDVGGELSLHHAFNPSTATKIVMMVQDIEEYLQKVCSPLQDQVALKNVLTGEIVTNHEITNSAFFLVDKDGYLRKSAKSQLGAELLKLCPLIDKKGPQTSPKTHAAIIDFMALVRKVPLKKLHPPVKTFHDFAIALTSMVTKAGNNCDEIHIVFDTYREDSIKNGERERRGKSKDMVVLDDSKTPFHQLLPAVSLSSPLKVFRVLSLRALRALSSATAGTEPEKRFQIVAPREDTALSPQLICQINSLDCSTVGRMGPDHLHSYSRITKAN
ncbi:hypothetical protein F7725_026978 [Dissostichus mawsoni]|uniref:Uncharacterized protein n=1 Tax=Dissostichus mawsoni TaxID=36200 RepID=A0A7J5X914_DISMA|nr:hypothetical protein F7725_026978 [Dissostichus mawsoni]